MTGRPPSLPLHATLPIVTVQTDEGQPRTVKVGNR
jgi:hypothetical protein